MEDFNLTSAEVSILNALIKAEKPLSVKDIIETDVKITRYYIYEVLTRLSTYNLVITHGNKPKKYSSSKDLVEQYIQNLEKERSDHISNIKSEDIDRNLQAFHFNELQQQIFKVIMKNDLTIQQIVLKLNSYLKDEATNPNSLVERYLKIMYNNHLIKRLRKGKSLKYSYYALPISDIKKNVLNIYLINVEKQIQRINEFLSQIESNPASNNILNTTIGSILSKFSIETILKILDRLPQEVVAKYREGINQLKDQYINAKKIVENPAKIETDLVRDVKL
jgi:hypothetical protein